MSVRRTIAAEVALALLLIAALSILIVSRSPFFPDFLQYDWYVETDRYFRRFFIEPVSATLMWLSALGKWGAEGYYLFVWLTFVVTVLVISVRHYPTIWFTVAMFLMFNPLTLVAYRTPRSFTALVAFLWVLHSKRVRRGIAVALSILSHNITGAFVVCLMVVRRMGPVVQVLMFGAALTIFYLMSTTDLARYFISEIDRGRAQALYAFTFLVLFIFLLCRKRVEYLYFVALFVFISAIYALSPYAYRFYLPWLIWAFLFAAATLTGRDSRLILRAYALLSVTGSLAFVSAGKFGYG